MYLFPWDSLECVAVLRAERTSLYCLAESVIVANRPSVLVPAPDQATLEYMLRILYCKQESGVHSEH